MRDPNKPQLPEHDAFKLERALKRERDRRYREPRGSVAQERENFRLRERERVWEDGYE